MLQPRSVVFEGCALAIKWHRDELRVSGMLSYETARGAVIAKFGVDDRLCDGRQALIAWRAGSP